VPSILCGPPALYQEISKSLTKLFRRVAPTGVTSILRWHMSMSQQKPQLKMHTLNIQILGLYTTHAHAVSINSDSCHTTLTLYSLHTLGCTPGLACDRKPNLANTTEQNRMGDIRTDPDNRMPNARWSVDDVRRQ